MDINFPQKWVYYLFFTEEVTKSQKSNFPKVTYLTSSTSRFEPRPICLGFCALVLNPTP